MPFLDLCSSQSLGYKTFSCPSRNPDPLEESKRKQKWEGRDRMGGERRGEEKNKGKLENRE